MKMTLNLMFSLMAGAVIGAPAVSNVKLTRDAENHVVAVSYDLSEPAIVTATFSAGAAELSPETVGAFGGEISRELAAGTHVFFLRPTLEAGNAFFDAKELSVGLEAWPLDCPPPYMAINLLAKDSRRFYPSERWVPGGVTNRQYKLDTLLMRKVIATDVKWPMGKDGADAKTEFKTRYVTLTGDYYVAVYETTQRQYRDLLPNRQFKAKQGAGNTRAVADPPYMTVRADRDVLPMEGTTWHTLRNGTNQASEATCIWPQDGHQVASKSWIGLLRARTGVEFDLPTEAQWEYACRGGTATAQYDTLDEVAWYTTNWKDDPAAVANGNSNQVHEVGLLKPNRWGLYDTLGNVNEQCLDYMPNDTTAKSGGWTDPNYPTVCDLYYAFEGEIVDPVGPGSHEMGAGDTIEAPLDGNRPRRGGGFSQSAKYQTATMRTRHTAVNGYAFAGFRLVCPATFVK